MRCKSFNRLLGFRMAGVLRGAARRAFQADVTRIQSHRTQFMHRITQFADSNQLEIELVYFPPYHSKYNPIERCWSALERHGNGTLLTSVTPTTDSAQLIGCER
jgi:transposase